MFLASYVQTLTAALAVEVTAFSSLFPRVCATTTSKPASKMISKDETSPHDDLSNTLVSPAYSAALKRATSEIRICVLHIIADTLR